MPFKIRMEGQQQLNIVQAQQKVIVTAAEFGAKYKSKREVGGMRSIS